MAVIWLNCVCKCTDLNSPCVCLLPLLCCCSYYLENEKNKYKKNTTVSPPDQDFRVLSPRNSILLPVNYVIKSKTFHNADYNCIHLIINSQWVHVEINRWTPGKMHQTETHKSQRHHLSGHASFGFAATSYTNWHTGAAIRQSSSVLCEQTSAENWVEFSVSMWEGLLSLYLAALPPMLCISSAMRSSPVAFVSCLLVRPSLLLSLPCS